jgi:hypothetical protein
MPKSVWFNVSSSEWKRVLAERLAPELDRMKAAERFDDWYYRTSPQGQEMGLGLFFQKGNALVALERAPAKDLQEILRESGARALEVPADELWEDDATYSKRIGSPLAAEIHRQFQCLDTRVWTAYLAAQGRDESRSGDDAFCLASLVLLCECFGIAPAERPRQIGRWLEFLSGHMPQPEAWLEQVKAAAEGAWSSPAMSGFLGALANGDFGRFNKILGPAESGLRDLAARLTRELERARTPGRDLAFVFWHSFSHDHFLRLAVDNTREAALSWMVARSGRAEP